MAVGLLGECDVKKENITALVIEGKAFGCNTENSFMDQFGLRAQLLRRSGNIWLETSITDSWKVTSTVDV